MARPRKPPNERREASINPRLTEAERATIVRHATVLGISPGDFMRRTALDYALPASLAARRQTAAESVALMKLAVNLNQIAKHANAGRGLPPHLSDVLAQIKAELDRIYDREGDGGRTVV